MMVVMMMMFVFVVTLIIMMMAMSGIIVQPKKRVFVYRCTAPRHVIDMMLMCVLTHALSGICILWLSLWICLMH